MNHRVQRIDIAGLADEPVYCPFCGTQTLGGNERPPTRENPTACQHLLFVGDDACCQFASDRFLDNLGIGREARRRLEASGLEGLKARESIDACSIPHAICFVGRCGDVNVYVGFAAVDPKRIVCAAQPDLPHAGVEVGPPEQPPAGASQAAGGPGAAATSPADGIPTEGPCTPRPGGGTPVLQPRPPAADDGEAWWAEAVASLDGIERRDYEVAEAAELPEELSAHVEAAALDPDFGAEFDEWLEHLLNHDDPTVTLALEQSCELGVLLPWDMRGVRLATAPAETLSALHRLLEACPRHVVVHLAHYVYWLLRSERARRRGSPRWSPSLQLAPTPSWMQDPPAFKPMKSWPRRWP